MGFVLISCFHAASQISPLTPISPEKDLEPLEPIAVEPTIPSSQRQFYVVLDPGHGGKDIGAVGQNGAAEKDISLSITELILRKLEKNSEFSVLVTREGRDIDFSDTARINFINKQEKLDICISIHTGASYSPEAHGFEIFTPKLMGVSEQLEQSNKKKNNIKESVRLARLIAVALENHTGLLNRGIRSAPCRILNKLQVPAVLIEVGVLTHPEEGGQLISKEFQDKIASGIAEGIQQYFKEIP